METISRGRFGYKDGSIAARDRRVELYLVVVSKEMRHDARASDGSRIRNLSLTCPRISSAVRWREADLRLLPITADRFSRVWPLLCTSTGPACLLCTRRRLRVFIRCVKRMSAPKTGGPYWSSTWLGVFWLTPFSQQVYTITCADTVLEYTTKKEERGGPESSMAEGSKVGASVSVTERASTLASSLTLDPHAVVGLHLQVGREAERHTLCRNPGGLCRLYQEWTRQVPQNQGAARRVLGQAHWQDGLVVVEG